MTITREQARSYVGHCVDDSANPRAISEIPTPDTNVRYVGWQCGAEPMVVAVWSYLPGVTVGDDEAAELAVDLLLEKLWFEMGPAEPDFIL